MDPNAGSDALHVALKYIAGACIDEDLPDEAEQMHVFLDLIRISPRTIGLIYVWTRSQRGDLREALRRCTELSEIYPDAEEFLPLLAILRYACGDPTWAAVCDRMIDSPTSRPESRSLARRLLDGSFNKKPEPGAAPVAAEAPEVGAGSMTDAFDFAAHASFMRA